jgi:hypothetical protein
MTAEPRSPEAGANEITAQEQLAEPALTGPMSGRIRSVPMAPDVATTLARLTRRAHWTGEETSSSPAGAAITSTRQRRIGATGWR